METTLLTVGNIIFGGYFFFSGLNHFMKAEAMTKYATYKGLPLPKVSNTLAGLFLLLGGVGIILGSWYQIVSAILLVIFLFLSNFLIHTFWKESESHSKMIESTNFWKNWALIGACLIILAHALLN